MRSIRVTRIDDAAALALASVSVAPTSIGAYFGDQRGRLRLSMTFELEHAPELASWPLGLPDRSLRTALLVSNEPVARAASEDRIVRWLRTRANFAKDGVELVDWMVVDADLLESMSLRSGVGRWARGSSSLAAADDVDDVDGAA
ncbi:MAG: hypothetical protein AB7Q42_24135 [Acidimicrobiia bacterium]